MGEHRITLEDDAPIRPAFGRERRSVEEDGSAGRGFLAEDEAQQAALARAGRPDDRDERSRLHVERHPLEHDLLAIFDPDVAE